MTVDLPVRHYELDDYKSDEKPTWCPGCGDFGVLNAVYRAMRTRNFAPHEVVAVSGIGCSSRIPYFISKLIVGYILVTLLEVVIHVIAKHSCLLEKVHAHLTYFFIHVKRVLVYRFSRENSVSRCDFLLKAGFFCSYTCCFWVHLKHLLLVFYP